MRRRNLEAVAGAVGNARQVPRRGSGDAPANRRCHSTRGRARSTPRRGRRNAGTCRGSAVRAARRCPRRAWVLERRTSRVDRSRGIAAVLAEERIAHAIDEAADRRESRWRSRPGNSRRRLADARGVAHREDRLVTEWIASHAQVPSTIGVGPTLVKTAPVLPSSAARQLSCPTHESARCAAARCSSSRHPERRRVYRVSDTPPKKTLEWVCPDCDYFEEAEEKNA